ncbi:DUF6531 domain-containing protein [Spartinivicinus ruber]|uniref:DUF6531 domain-containing protein n=1 Tax=Spartinivicinus ruber TaxID=2683272 RepID=UPI0013D49E56|nr:DUF6531 domain-containing protein [Spartinivicinus ruber]
MGLIRSFSFLSIFLLCSSFASGNDQYYWRIGLTGIYSSYPEKICSQHAKQWVSNLPVGHSGEITRSYYTSDRNYKVMCNHSSFNGTYETLCASCNRRKCPSNFVFDYGLKRCEVKQPKKNTGSGDCSQPETTKSTGNPIRVSTGNKYQVETDITGVIPFTRYYNSELKGWSHQYQYQIQQPQNNPSLIYLIRPDGKVLSAKLDNEEWKTDSDVFLAVTRTDQTPAGWLIKKGKQQEFYDSQGRLISLEKANGEVLTSEWVDKQQVIKDTKGNQLTITYDDAHFLSSVKLNNRDAITYTYDKLFLLTQVTYKTGKTRQYHYENEAFPYHLTGIIDENGVRFATWTYDDQGRATSSEHAGGKEKVTLAFHDNNSTTVTNPLGKKTTYHFQSFNGVNKVVKVEGHQSANCAAANKEYTYYPTGLLKTKTDWKGNTTEYKYNDQGLQIEKTEAVGTPQARTITTEWDVEKRLPLKSSDGKLETLYQYDEQGKLANKKQVSQQPAK